MDDYCITISDDEDVQLIKHVVNLEPVIIDLTSTSERLTQSQKYPKQSTRQSPEHSPQQSQQNAQPSPQPTPNTSPISPQPPSARPPPRPSPQPAERPIFRPAERPIPQSAERPIPQSADRPIPQSAERPIPQSADRPIPQSAERPIPQSAERPIPQSAERPIPQSAERPIPQSAERPIPQSAERQIPQSAERPTPKPAEQPSTRPASQSKTHPAPQPTPQPKFKLQPTSTPPQQEQPQLKRQNLTQTYDDRQLMMNHKELGNEKYKHNLFDDAIRMYKRASEFAKKLGDKDMSAILHFNLAMTYFKVGSLDQAADECANAVKINDKYIKAHLKRAEIYLRQRKFEEAVICYEHVCELDSTNKDYAILLNHAKREAAKQPKKQDYYQLLGLNTNFTREDLKKAYRRQALSHHPDRHSDADIVTRRIQEKHFKDAAEAHKSILVRFGC